MKLYVDDIRRPPAGWALARTVEEAIEKLDTGMVSELSLDYVIGYSAETNFTPVARHVASLPADKRPQVVYLHTSSSSGARELESILQGAVPRIVRL